MKKQFYCLYAFKFRKRKSKKSFCQCEYEKWESAIFLYVEANINSIKILKNYLWRSSYLTKFIKTWDSFKAKFWASRFSRRYEPRWRFTEIHSRTPTLSSTLFCDNLVKLLVIFVILLYKTVVCQKLIRQ